MNSLKIILISLRDVLRNLREIFIFMINGGRYRAINEIKKNNYSSFMLNKIKANKSLIETGLRSIILDYVVELTKSLNNKKALKIVDYGGGIAMQATYISKHNPKSEIFIYEQRDLVTGISSLHTEFVNNLKSKKIIYKSSEDKIIYCDLILFIGSLSYLPNTYDVLNDSKKKADVILISRLPISNDLEEDIFVHDNSGNHSETIFSKSKFEEYLNNTFKLCRKYYEVEPKLSKRYPVSSVMVSSATYILLK